MRVCVVTPGHLATNPRVVKEASALADAGHVVTVVCGDYAKWARKFDQDIAADAAWQKTVHVSFGPHADRLTYARQSVVRRLANFAFEGGWQSHRVAEIAHAPIVGDLKRAVRLVKADLYIAHYVAALPAVSEAAHMNGAKFIFDAEDFHLGDPPNGAQGDRLREKVRVIEGYYLPKAAGMTAASPLIADAYHHEYGIARPTPVLNVFPIAQAPNCATPSGVDSSRRTIHWFSQTVGPDRGLEVAIRAAALSKCRPTLVLRGNISDGYKSSLIELASSLSFPVSLEFLGIIPAKLIEIESSKYDVGLCAETGETRNHDIALANKIFSFLLSGIPVLLSDTRAHQALFKDLGCAARLFHRDDPSSLASAMDSVMSNPADLAAARAHAFRLGQDRFNWDIEKLSLLKLISSVCSPEAPVLASS